MNHAVNVLQTSSLEFAINAATGHWSLHDRSADQRLLIGTAAHFFQPVFNDQPVAATLAEIRQPSSNQIELQFQCAQLAAFTVTLLANSQTDCFDIQCSFQTTQSTQLNRLDLFPAGTQLNLYNVINFRNHHGTSATWPELPLADRNCQTDTYSRDWQFAPHPTAFVFRKSNLNLFFGALDLPQAFGMYISVDKYVTRQWHLEFGAAPHGQPLAAGETFTSPRFRLFARQNQTPYETYTVFGRMLIDEKIIPDPQKKTRHTWWREPLYCTWIDQTMVSSAEIPQELQAQTTAIPNHPRLHLTEKLVRDAVAIIQREKLPFRTILLDEGWNLRRGDWQPDPERFPNLRGLVDDLHAQGFKVVIWWSWAEIDKDAEPNPAHLIAGGKLNRHGCRMRDYSHPATQNEYLRPLFKKLFSPDAGCYNLDGIKTDFLADKVHADMPVHDPAWRGEENYFYHLTHLYYQEMKRHKPDAVHIGCAGHYWLADFIDINRTYDVFSSDPMEHESRARMLLATCPGCPVAYDFHNYIENLDGWFASATQLGASIQIGNLMRTRRDIFADSAPATPVYYDQLRRNLRANADALTRA